mmetsp:Transcript_3465/g.6103  ORF Transcript_3465/g.6103 Transcript_3465/m.6103 type:complete len:83 (-) Transcript_3465:89-337(-)
MLPATSPSADNPNQKVWATEGHEGRVSLQSTNGVRVYMHATLRRTAKSFLSRTQAAFEIWIDDLPLFSGSEFWRSRQKAFGS